jgi:hypothetical protein
MPVADRRATLAAVAILLAWFGFAATRHPYWLDSSELALAGATRGLGHPPGHPLYIALGALLSSVFPFAKHGAMVALSVVPMALAAIPVVSLVEQLSPLLPARGVGPLVALVLLGLQLPAWELGTKVEVYALGLFLLLLHAALLVRALKTGASPRLQLALGLVVGLCASTNPVIAALGGAATLPCLRALLAAGGPSTFARLVGGGLLGLLPYLYIPLAARFSSGFRWGDPVDLASLERYLTAADFQRNVRTDGAMFLEHVWSWAAAAGRQGQLPLVLAGAVAWLGATALPRTARLFGPLVLALGVCSVAYNTPFLTENPDYEGYLFGGVLLCEIALFAMLGRLTARPGLGGPALLAGCLLVVGTVWSTASPTLPDRARRGGMDAARVLATAILDEVGPDGVLLAASDNLVFPLLWLQEVEGHRPDVVVLNGGFAGSSWYWRHLARRHPGLRLPPLRPGSRGERIARFLAENPGRSVRAESLELVLPGYPVCHSGHTLLLDPICTDLDRAATVRSRETLTGLVDRFCLAGTLDSRALAWVALSWGRDAERLGRLPLASLSYRAGLPTSWREQVPPPDDLEGLAEGPRHPRPHSFPRLLAEPRDLLYSMAILYIGAGDLRGFRLLRDAGQLGVPELVDEGGVWR